MTQRPTRLAQDRPTDGFVRHAHHIMIGILVAFILAAIVLGEMLDVYDAVWWWDDMLHGSSGFIFGLVGLFLVYAINKRSDMRISPLFVAVFVACFAVSMGVVWEIYEFISDVSFHTTMQQWNMGPHAIVMGRDYQGMGLRDSMSDLIVATIGALFAGVFAYFAYSRRRQTLLQVMRQAFPAVKKKR